MFLESKAKIDRKRLSKSRYSTLSEIKKKDLSISCLLKESASILEQVSRRYGDLKVGVFVTK